MFECCFHIITADWTVISYELINNIKHVALLSVVEGVSMEIPFDAIIATV